MYTFVYVYQYTAQWLPLYQGGDNSAFLPHCWFFLYDGMTCGIFCKGLSSNSFKKISFKPFWQL